MKATIKFLLQFSDIISITDAEQLSDNLFVQ